ncbi:MAG: MMPL family transporter [Thermodesulfobacteriota bacterium]
MKEILANTYNTLILKKPALSLALTLIVIGFFAWHIPDFKLDASGDSLVLENDADLYYSRQITERYGTSDVLIITYTAKDDLFGPDNLASIKKLRDQLKEVGGVESVTTILDVPLIVSTGISLSKVADKDNIKTLEDGGIDRQMVIREMAENPLYKGRLLSDDGQTTALLVNLPADKAYRDLLSRRYQLREKKYLGELSAAEAQELVEVTAAYRQDLTRVQHKESRLVEAVRQVIAGQQGSAELHLGGVPMIAADMVSYIGDDLVVFGVGVAIFMIITLSIVFRRIRWVFLSMLCCGAAVVTMIGFLGFMDWRVTVISSNFISLMIILTMALTIHLIERYLEIHAENPATEQRQLVLATVKTIVRPCLYTTATTVVAFASLIVSGIRPVIDFGMMMTMGLVVSFILAFVLFPATVCLLKNSTAEEAEDFSDPFTLKFARITEHHGTKVLIGFLIIGLLSVVGIDKLKVDNRFIDYFREKTEIFQGMSLIDQKLGGTTPLDLIIDFKLAGQDDMEDEFEDEEFFGGEEDSAEDAKWYADVYTMEQIEAAHNHLDGLAEVGEILSIATLGKVTTILNDDVSLANYELAILHKKIPDNLKDVLVKPYVSEDITQARFTMRIIESDKNLDRQKLLTGIREHLTGELGFTDDQIHFTGMYVLYNNMLESLFHSQIMTIGLVFLGIMAMFFILFRSLYLALIAIVPNTVPVLLVLGCMGWLGISLDMMTITIASICIGISVHDTIHYIHRFQKEFIVDRNYQATINRCHCSIGRAIYYTTVTITIGFSILVLSNFIPTIYFGLFTGLAMIIALMADLTLLPKLLILLKPLGREDI